MVMNSTKFPVVCFCSLFGPDRAHNTIVVYCTERKTKQYKRFRYVIHAKCMNAKTKDCARSWSFQNKSWHLCLLL